MFHHEEFLQAAFESLPGNVNLFILSDAGEWTYQEMVAYLSHPMHLNKWTYPEMVTDLSYRMHLIKWTYTEMVIY